MSIMAIGSALLVLAAGIAMLAITWARRMKRYQKRLEEEVAERTAELEAKSLELERKSQEAEEARRKSEETLMNILPKNVAQQLSANPNIIIADEHKDTTILFSDIVGFTKLSSGMSAAQVVTMLNDLFTLFDMRAEAEGVEKIKTIGDAYMAVVGLNGGSAEDNALLMIKFAQGMLEDLENFNLTTGLDIRIRIGLNSGTIVAGVIGKTKFIYDIWGDAVNVASRMESTGSPDAIHVSESTFLSARGKSKDVKFQGPVMVEAKGKGLLRSYFVKNTKESENEGAAEKEGMEG